jgi:P-type Cu2+ transporter
VRTGEDPADERRAQRIELLRVLLAWLAMMQVMMLAVPSYLARAGRDRTGHRADAAHRPTRVERAGGRFLRGPFWRAAPASCAWAASAWTCRWPSGWPAPWQPAAGHGAGKGAVYFDSVTMFVALLLAVRWWQMRALARTTAQVDAAARQSRLRARRLRRRSVHGAYDTVPAEQLRTGEFILVPVGEAIAADGRIVEGSTSVSQAWLTGESVAWTRPRARPCSRAA